MMMGYGQTQIQGVDCQDRRARACETEMGLVLKGIQIGILLFLE